MRYLALAAAFALALAPVAAPAQQKDATQSYDRSKPGSSNIRNYTLRNTANETISEASVQLSDNSTRSLTETGPITKNHAQTFAAPGGACVTSVHVKFQNGRSLDAQGITDCTAQTLVVDDGRILAQGSPTAGPPAPVQVSPAN
jgi:hypothetical protein